MNDVTTATKKPGKFDLMTVPELEALVAEAKANNKAPSSLLLRTLRARRSGDRGKPVPGQQYRLTGGPGVACIANGNTLAESAVEAEPISVVPTAAELAEFGSLLDDDVEDEEVEDGDIPGTELPPEAPELTAAERLELERNERVAAARAEIEAEDAARQAERQTKAAACGTDARVPDLSLASERKAPVAPVAGEIILVHVTANGAKRVDRKASVPVAEKPAAKPAKAEPKPKPAAKAPKPAKAVKADGAAPVWQADAAKVADATHQGGLVVALLGEAGPLTDGQVAERLGKSPAWTNRVTLSLAFVGLTRRERDGRAIVNLLP